MNGFCRKRFAWCYYRSLPESCCERLFNTSYCEGAWSRQWTCALPLALHWLHDPSRCCSAQRPRGYQRRGHPGGPQQRRLRPASPVLVARSWHHGRQCCPRHGQRRRLLRAELHDARHSRRRALLVRWRGLRWRAPRRQWCWSRCCKLYGSTGHSDASRGGKASELVITTVRSGHRGQHRGRRHRLLCSTSLTNGFRCVKSCGR
mmetsp:Transcript_85183/g.214826  ORF Transcript_85183/g.214826 Transcript_85183/m.214826 type:complete len:204 (+) Transcript_85183:860-1471(+)